MGRSGLDLSRNSSRAVSSFWRSVSGDHSDSLTAPPRVNECMELNTTRDRSDGSAPSERAPRLHRFYDAPRQKDGGTQIKLIIDYPNSEQALFKPMSCEATPRLSPSRPPYHEIGFRLALDRAKGLKAKSCLVMAREHRGSATFLEPDRLGKLLEVSAIKHRFSTIRVSMEL
uniref:Uncharacterized protein n=1 Tax=Timema genevievae TaxID=629358 RepID=A0A7R9JRG9_TIMGE|nr:unnamed protein product [Timema genevievae]